MKTKTSLIAAAVALGLAVPMTMGATAAYAQCTHGERIDGSTADQARVKIQRAGFSNVTGLHKGCDNYWHGIANQGGGRVGVVLAPSGEVMVESVLDQPPGMSGGTSYTVPSDQQPAISENRGYDDRSYDSRRYDNSTYPQRGYPETQRAIPETQRAVPVYPESQRAYPRN
jgi:hypothetical protein